MFVAERRTAVERDDARVVHHLVGNDYRIGRLQYSRAVAIDRRPERADHAARDAAIVEVEIEHAVERPDAVRAGSRAPRLRFRKPRWDAAVGRVDHHRRVAEGARALLVAERARRAAVLRLPRSLARHFALREFLVAQMLPRAVLRRTRLGYAAHVVRRPYALQVGMTPRGARRCPARVDARGGL